MPLCAAVGCANRREKGFLMKSFPRNKERRAIWAAQVNRAAWFPSDRSCLCQIHFESSMWLPGTTKLRPTAIPTLFMRQPTKQRCSSKKYYEDIAEENHKEEEEIMILVNDAGVNSQDPLSLTEDCHVVNDRLCEADSGAEVLYKEEMEIWTEDCISGLQRIENYKVLEKSYEASDILGEQDGTEKEIEEETFCIPPELVTCVEDKQAEGDAKQKEISTTSKNPVNNSEVEEIEILSVP